MTPEQHIVVLSAREVTYLRNADVLPTTLAGALDLANSMDGRSFSVRVTRDVAEELSDLFTERLAKVGFDSNYQVNSEGDLLEQLIDRFFIP
jgi:hypothetical protein